MKLLFILIKEKCIQLYYSNIPVCISGYYTNNEPIYYVTEFVSANSAV